MQSLDPNSPGPLGLCTRCWTPISKNVAFCAKCGYVGTVFEVPISTMFGKPVAPVHFQCANHKQVTAVVYCCLCAKPICEECIGEKRISSLPWFDDVYYCKACVQTKQNLEDKFFRRLEETSDCAKHVGQASRFKCIECDLPLCAACSYFLVGGLFRSKITGGPYCISCYRVTTRNDRRTNWISGIEAVCKNLIKSNISN